MNWFYKETNIFGKDGIIRYAKIAEPNPIEAKITGRRFTQSAT